MQARARYLAILCCAVLILCCEGLGQKNELAVTVGGYAPIGVQTDVHVAAVIEGSYARRFFSVPLASVYAEFPVVRTFDVGLSAIEGNYTATFVTPGLKLKLAPEFPISPFFVAGLGVAHFSASGTLAGTSLGRSSTSAAFDVGGGVDVKVFPFVSLRGEVRNINSGGVGFAIPLISGRQNNIMGTGGIVVRF